MSRKCSPSLELILARCVGAYSDNTLRGYQNDLEQFVAWCKSRRRCWLPASVKTVASFIEHETADKSIATIKRRLYAIKFVHRMADLPLSTAHSEVRLALRRAGRLKIRRPKQVPGLTVDLLEHIIAACPDTLAGRRDAALISVGYDTLCRSSELVAIRVDHLSGDGATVCIPRSKSDQLGDGRTAYLSARTQKMVAEWLEFSGLAEGALFRSLHTGKLKTRHISTSSVRRIVKRAAARARLEAKVAQGLSGHSMRIGAAQDMMLAGIDTLGIMQVGGWRTYPALARYVENASGETLHRRRFEQLIGARGKVAGSV